MNSCADEQLLRRHWRTFLPLWLLPLPIVGTVLLGDFGARGFLHLAVPYIIVAILIYFVIAEIRVLGLWRRGEITYLQSLFLALPLAVVAILCVLFRIAILQLFRS